MITSNPNPNPDPNLREGLEESSYDMKKVARTHEVVRTRTYFIYYRGRVLLM